MPTNQTERDSLLASLTMDAGLRQLLQMMSDDNRWAKEQLDPVILQASLDSVTTDLPLPSEPLTFDFTLNSTHIKLEWTADDTAIYFYEIRVGASWDAGTFVLRTLSLDAELEPILEGDYIYWIKSANQDMEFSLESLSVAITIPAIEIPSNIIPLVIDNHVLLDWDAPASTFKIDHYNLYEQETLRGSIDSTFYGFFESTAGSYEYGIVAVDIAGNVSAKATIEVEVREPPDFVFEDSYDSIFDGTKVKCQLYDNKLLCTMNTVETFEEHFDDNVWLSPAEQIAAGYPIYIQPSQVAGGYYEEEYDWGQVYQDTIVNVTWTYETIFSTVGVTCQIWGKELIGDDWTGPIGGVSGFFTDVRYIKVRLTFTPDTDKCLIWLLTIRFLLDVKKAVDAGQAIPDEDDVSGTEVFFNETFKRVDSVSAGTEDVEPLWVAIDKPTGTDPTSFHIYVFDSEGNRVGDGATGPVVYWTARGVI